MYGLHRESEVCKEVVNMEEIYRRAHVALDEIITQMIENYNVSMSEFEMVLSLSATGSCEECGYHEELVVSAELAIGERGNWAIKNRKWKRDVELGTLEVDDDVESGEGEWQPSEADGDSRDVREGIIRNASSMYDGMAIGDDSDVEMVSISIEVDRQLSSTNWEKEYSHRLLVRDVDGKIVVEDHEENTEEYSTEE